MRPRIQESFLRETGVRCCCARAERAGDANFHSGSPGHSVARCDSTCACPRCPAVPSSLWLRLLPPVPTRHPARSAAAPASESWDSVLSNPPRVCSQAHCLCLSQHRSERRPLCSHQSRDTHSPAESPRAQPWFLPLFSAGCTPGGAFSGWLPGGALEARAICKNAQSCGLLDGFSRENRSGRPVDRERGRPGSQLHRYC